MIHIEKDSPLGKKSAYETTHNPQLLFAIEREPRRIEHGIIKVLDKMHGYDIINLYELSWLDPQSKPMVGIGQLKVPSNSKCIIESKSLKLYCNSLNNHKFASIDEVTSTIKQDLSKYFAATVDFQIIPPSTLIEAGYAHGQNIDHHQINGDFSTIRSDALTADGEVVEESLHTHLFKANCLVTGQPDWATMEISYRGKRIDQKGLLQYLISYRNSSGFAEHGVEQIFADIMQACAPEELTVYGLYTRRGGIEINPFRSTNVKAQPHGLRLLRS